MAIVAATCPPGNFSELRREPSFPSCCRCVLNPVPPFSSLRLPALRCQVHFNEDKTNYMKLDVVLAGQLALRCVEEFRPTSSGPQKAELRVCHVSGLVLLRPQETIRLQTIPNVQLKADRYLTYFGLFQVH